MVDKFLDSLIKLDIAIEEFELADDAPHILKDDKIEVIYKVDKEEVKLRMKRVAFFSKKAIEIQIWYALIALLLLDAIHQP